MKCKNKIKMAVAAIPMLYIATFAGDQNGQMMNDMDSDPQGAYRNMPADSIDPLRNSSVRDKTYDQGRDRSERKGITADNQSNKPADIDLTKRIRSEVVAQKSLSVNAQNVKIITINGRVTLKGEVKTEEEKQRIGNIAAKIAGAENVSNKLEINK